MTHYSANIFWLTSYAGTVLGTEAVSMRKTDAFALLALILAKRKGHVMIITSVYQTGPTLCRFCTYVFSKLAT